MPAKTEKGSVRIIAGEWRSRRLPVPDLPGLRPSTDRCRETLFNWLHPYLPGAVCADLFAGTGVLGFEAASRGAKSVTLVDGQAGVVEHLRSSIELLKAEQVRVRYVDAIRWLRDQPPDSLDMIFADPPFADRVFEEVFAAIGQSGCLRAGGFVYLESPAFDRAPATPRSWTCWREKVVGDVRLQVFRRQGGTVE